VLPGHVARACRDQDRTPSSLLVTEMRIAMLAVPLGYALLAP
jgi:hypothetical protein